MGNIVLVFIFSVVSPKVGRKRLWIRNSNRFRYQSDARTAIATGVEFFDRNSARRSRVTKTRYVRGVSFSCKISQKKKNYSKNKKFATEKTRSPPTRSATTTPRPPRWPRCTSFVCTDTPRTWLVSGRRPLWSNRPCWRPSRPNSRAPTGCPSACWRSTPTGWTDSGTRAVGAARRWRTSRTRRRRPDCPGSTPVRRRRVWRTERWGRRRHHRRRHHHRHLLPLPPQPPQRPRWPAARRTSRPYVRRGNERKTSKRADVCPPRETVGFAKISRGDPTIWKNGRNPCQRDDTRKYENLELHGSLSSVFATT